MSGENMYSKNDVFAVIVSYNCPNTIDKSIQSLLEQVDYLLIVDNNSAPEHKALLRKWEEHQRVTVHYNEINEGIAFALNQGLKYATKMEKKLLLTMDQDSNLSSDAIEQMVAVLNCNDLIVSVGPVYRHTYGKNDYEIVGFLITSGNLTIVEKANEIGGFTNKLFIDSVDMDFSFALKVKGYQVAIANKATMQHKIGEYETRKIFHLEFKYLDHNATRYYYIYRNHIYIFRKYMTHFPGLCMKMFCFLILDSLKLLVIEKSKKQKILKAFQGIKDGFGL
jgi:rhamnosyltransferase